MLFPILLLIVSILGSTTFINFEIPVLFWEQVSIFKPINKYISDIVEYIADTNISDWIVYIITYSDSRALTAYANTLAIIFLAFYNIFQYFKRPENV